MMDFKTILRDKIAAVKKIAMAIPHTTGSPLPKEYDDVMRKASLAVSGNGVAVSDASYALSALHKRLIALNEIPVAVEFVNNCTAENDEIDDLSAEVHQLHKQIGYMSDIATTTMQELKTAQQTINRVTKENADAAANNEQLNEYATTLNTAIDELAKENNEISARLETTIADLKKTAIEMRDIKVEIDSRAKLSADEINNLQARLTEKKNDLEVSEEFAQVFLRKVRECDEKNEKLSKELANQQTINKTQRANLNKHRGRKKKIGKLQVALRNMINDKEDAEDELASLKKKNDINIAEKKEADARLIDMNKKLTQLKYDKDALEEKCDTDEKNFEKALADADEEAGRLGVKLSETSGYLAKRNDECRENKKNRDQSEERLDAIAKSLVSARAEKKEIEDELATLKKEGEKNHADKVNADAQLARMRDDLNQLKYNKELLEREANEEKINAAIAIGQQSIVKEEHHVESMYKKILDAASYMQVSSFMRTLQNIIKSDVSLLRNLSDEQIDNIFDKLRSAGNSRQSWRSSDERLFKIVAQKAKDNDIDYFDTFTYVGGDTFDFVAIAAAFMVSSTGIMIMILLAGIVIIIYLYPLIFPKNPKKNKAIMRIS